MGDFRTRSATPPPPLTQDDRTRLTVELHRLGLAIRRERFRREHPAATEAELDLLLQGWLDTEAAKEFAGREDLRPRPSRR